jgi:hypothetical protein
MLDWLKPGQEVICIDAQFTNATNAADLIEGDHYVIESVVDISGYVHLLGRNHYTGTGDDVLCVHLVGVRRRMSHLATLRIPFCYRRFKPVIKRQTDISSLEALLKTTKIKTPELV